MLERLRKVVPEIGVVRKQVPKRAVPRGVRRREEAPAGVGEQIPEVGTPEVMVQQQLLLGVGDTPDVQHAAVGAQARQAEAPLAGKHDFALARGQKRVLHGVYPRVQGIVLLEQELLVKVVTAHVGLVLKVRVLGARAVEVLQQLLLHLQRQRADHQVVLGRLRESPPEAELRHVKVPPVAARPAPLLRAAHGHVAVLQVVPDVPQRVQAFERLRNKGAHVVVRSVHGVPLDEPPPTPPPAPVSRDVSPLLKHVVPQVCDFKAAEPRRYRGEQVLQPAAQHRRAQQLLLELGRGRLLRLEAVVAAVGVVAVDHAAVELPRRLFFVLELVDELVDDGDFLVLLVNQPLLQVHLQVLLDLLRQLALGGAGRRARGVLVGHGFLAAVSPEQLALAVAPADAPAAEADHRAPEGGHVGDLHPVLVGAREIVDDAPLLVEADDGANPRRVRALRDARGRGEALPDGPLDRLVVLRHGCLLRRAPVGRVPHEVHGAPVGAEAARDLVQLLQHLLNALAVGVLAAERQAALLRPVHLVLLREQLQPHVVAAPPVDAGALEAVPHVREQLDVVLADDGVEVDVELVAVEALEPEAPVLPARVAQPEAAEQLVEQLQLLEHAVLQERAPLGRLCVNRPSRGGPGCGVSLGVFAAGTLHLQLRQRLARQGTRQGRVRVGGILATLLVDGVVQRRDRVLGDGRASPPLAKQITELFEGGTADVEARPAFLLRLAAVRPHVGRCSTVRSPECER
ncbi:LysR family transcriptional regulator [Babesia caballi]|uniref:LysR family transcriptional regulator n=1 Tax=Babesia caballi TaxID=5871 RepID=A0AAV4LPU4_BABCB|nr:LysR family transcriptional regulator [Babesia caballi]